LNHQRLRTDSNGTKGIAFGETTLISSPPSRSQKVKAKSGFGGWADEKIKIVREAVPSMSQKESHPQHLTVSRRLLDLRDHIL
jgi:hypothetical protein